MNTSRRDIIIGQLKDRLSMPRVQISVILGFTAVAAFAVSVILIRLGITSMALRYPLAVVAGYLAFLLLLRLWIWFQSESSSNSANIDIPVDIFMPNVKVGSTASDVGFSTGGGGDFAGAGAGGGWSSDEAPTPSSAVFFADTKASGSSSAGSGGFDFDLDDGIALLVVALVILLIFSALIYVVYIAPILLAELVVDAAVVSSFYRPVRNIERRYWLTTALRKTAIPAIIVVILIAIAGMVMQMAEPDVITIGQFLHTVLA